jgi:small GTP-binding protein
VNSRKICILGDFAVGKTSLVRRFVQQQFGDKYLTTVGVKVDTKTVTLNDGRALKLAIWDVAGTDTPTELFLRYARGAAGLLLVADVTRAETLGCCRELYDAVSARLGPLPHVLLANKCDLAAQRELPPDAAEGLFDDAVARLDTSALTGENVDLAFAALARGLLDAAP